MTKVRECFNLAPVTAPPQCSSAEAASLMATSGVGALLVVDAGKLVGVVTDRDIVVRGVAASGAPDRPIANVMTPSPVTIDGSADLEEALELFREGDFRRLPVLEDEELAGILTLDDALLRMVNQLQSLVQPVVHGLNAVHHGH